MHSHLINLALLILVTLCLFPSLFFTVLRLPIHVLSSPPVAKGCLQPNPLVMASQWSQKLFTLSPREKGSYLITSEIHKNVPEISQYKVGLLNLFVQHTSCALSLNENWDSEVREDMTDAMDRIAPEDKKGALYRHSAEGLDDMPVGDNFASDQESIAQFYNRHTSSQRWWEPA